MCRKRIFLISLVALLGLVNLASADACGWKCPYFSAWCNPSNWDCGHVPTLEDDAGICGPAFCSPVIHTGCDAVCYSLGGPCGGGNSRLDILGGSLTVGDRWRWAEDADGSIINIDGDAVVDIGGYWHASRGCIVNVTGTAQITVRDDYWRLSDIGTCTVTISDNPTILITNGGMRIGDAGGSADYCTFTVNGGTIVAGEFKFGEDSPCIFNMNGGSVYLDTLLNFEGRDNPSEFNMTGGELWIGDETQFDNYGRGTACTVNISGGILNAGSVLVPGGADEVDCEAVMNMTGGTVIARELFRVGCRGTGVVNLCGGTIECGDIEVCAGGSIDICEGQLVINGNQIAHIAELACVTGQLSGYGNPGCVIVDYDKINPGKTTVMGYWCEPIAPYCPQPPHGEVNVPCRDVVLCWQPGLGVGTRGRHCIYFGTDYNDVRDAEPVPIVPLGVFKGCQRAGQTCWPKPTDPEYPLHLPLWTTYCWRVDEHNEDGTVTIGDVWRFTTGCEDILGDINRDCLLNFDDFARLAETWGKQQFWPPKE